MDQDEDKLIGGLSRFEGEVAPRLKDLAKLLERLGRLKAVGRQAELLHAGDIDKQLQDALSLCEQAREQALATRELFGLFRLAPDEAGQVEWEQVFLKECRELKLAVEGEFPAYRVFPIEIKVALGQGLVMVNKRTVRTLHPKAVALRTAREIERLNRERFNPSQFMFALVRAYDLLAAEMVAKGSRKEAAKQQSLRRIYEVLAARTGAAGYSTSQFAFDIFRLRKGSDLVYGQRKLVFGPTRRPGEKGIEIPLPGGMRDTLASLEIAPVGSDYDGQS